MKKIFKEKTANFVIMAVVLFVAFFMGNSQLNAAQQKYVNIMHKISTATANSSIHYNFSLNRKSDIYFIIQTNEHTGATISIKDPNHDIPLKTVYLPTTNLNWEYKAESGIYRNTATVNLDSGNYVLEISFENDVNYDLSVNQVSPIAKLNRSKLTLTKGFTDQLKVNGGTIKKCSSSNKAVAEVNKKGKITANGIGKASIKVFLTNGKTLTCKVNVVENKYKTKKISINNTIFNTWDMKAYSAQFDSKGNLVVKFMIANDSYGKIDNIPKFKVTIKNANKKTTVVYTKNPFIVSVPSYKEKSCTITIPKSCFKTSKNKIDLRTSQYIIFGKIANASL